MTTYGLSRDLMPRRKIATPVSEVRTQVLSMTGGTGEVPLGHEMTKTWHTLLLLLLTAASTREINILVCRGLAR